MELQDLKAAIDGYSAATAAALKQTTTDIEALLDRIEELESKGKNPGSGNAGARQSQQLKGFIDYVRTGNNQGIQPVETKDMTIAGGAAAGAAMVPETLARQIIDRAIARSPLIGIVRNTPVPSGSYTRLVNLRGATAAWSSELGTRNGTNTPQLREVKPTHGELYAYPTVSNWLLNDAAFSVENFLLDNVSDVFATTLEAAILTGNASDKPKGIFDVTPVLTADFASPERDADAIQYVANTSSPTGTVLLPDSLLDTYFALAAEYRSRARWVMSSATLNKVRKLKDLQGQYLWQPGLQAGVDAGDGLLLGKPVVISELMQDAGNNNFPIMIGDWDQAYELTRIGGLAVIRDQVTTPGKTKLYVAARFGGRVTDNNAAKALRTV